MKLDVSVKNLGQIKEATFNIRPMTVITGPNGTGKSFFTKSLYSILNVANKNVYHKEIAQTLWDIQVFLTLSEGIESEKNQIIEHLSKLEDEFKEANKWKTTHYIDFISSKIDHIQNIYNEYLKCYPNSESQSDKSYNKTVNDYFNKLLKLIETPSENYMKLVSEQIQDELKDNFQISNLADLVSFGESELEIQMNDFHIIFYDTGKKIQLKTNTGFIDTITNFSNVVFFESPAYWKVRDALISVKKSQNRLRVLNKQSDDVLTGVPKYFYDLDDALTIKTKTEGAFRSATDILEKELDGEFIFNGDNLSFKDNTGREISKNLVSFGMTNLGMIQALLKHNVITEGSFIFIDEPETNLHPDWQVKLAEVLLVLAQGGVNIVITTHSSDFVKALEVKIKKLPIEIMEDFLSVHFVDVDGKLLEFESSDRLEQLIEARSLLNRAYEELYFSDL